MFSSNSLILVSLVSILLIKCIHAECSDTKADPISKKWARIQLALEKCNKFQTTSKNQTTTIKLESKECTKVKAESEKARVTAEEACAKAAQIAINSADSTKQVAKKACDDAALIAKNVADKAAAAAC